MRSYLVDVDAPLRATSPNVALQLTGKHESRVGDRARQSALAGSTQMSGGQSGRAGCTASRRGILSDARLSKPEYFSELQTLLPGQNARRKRISGTDRTGDILRRKIDARLAMLAP